MFGYARAVIASFPRLITPTVFQNPLSTDRAQLRGDIVAGITVAIVLIPQACGYALLLGLPPVNGLYAALFGVLAGALWGSSRLMITGPVGVMSLLTIAVLVPFSGDPARLIVIAALTAISVGVMQLLLGSFRLGFLVRLVPHTVLAGFSVGAAIVIAVTQLPQFLGVAASHHRFFFEDIVTLIGSVPRASVSTTAVGLASVLALMLFRRFGRVFPAALATMALATLMSYLLSLPQYGVSIVGTIPHTLPSITYFGLADVLSIGTTSVVLALVGFLGSLAVARSIAARTHERIDVDQELIGQGMANIASGIFGGYPVSGSFSISALNADVGGRTIFASVVAAVCIIVAIIFLSPLIYFLPRATLAAVILVSVLSLARPRDIRHLFTLSKTDGSIALLTCIATLLLQPQDAVLIGAIVALLVFLGSAMSAEVPEVGLHPEWQTLLRADKHPEVMRFPRVLIVRIDYSLVYANADRVVEEILHRIDERAVQDGKPIRTLICSFSGVNTIDASGIEIFDSLVHELERRHIRVATVYLKYPVHAAFERAGLLSRITALHNIDEIRAYSARFAHLDSINPTR
jgi:SulP family sulfate permease